MPKALSPFADEDEKTTIESGWEEEASTTIEQGEVAEKIRTLGLRPITNVTGSTPGQDEPTMDDQHANAALSMITPPAVHARMIITAGNDRGQEIDIIPGKTYTVGRALDNDIVLTDIAVSRKHFDLRFENMTWVLVDRGSGNGTVINGNVEDAPFMLANGDSIEIGNTTFRFDHPNGVPRNAFNDNASTNGFNHTGDIVTRNANSFEVDMEEEPSTVAGKPLRGEPLSMPEPEPAPAPLRSRSEERRPRTVPPPMPPPAPLPRPKATSNAPTMLPPSFGGPIAPPGSMPAIDRHPQVLGSSQVPAISANRPTMLASPSNPPPLAPMAQLSPMAQMAPMGMLPPQEAALANVMPTTIPGQGPPMQPSQPQIHALPFTYPNMAEHVQHVQSSQHAKMMVASSQPLRDATSTAHVPPTPYNGLPVMQPYTAPTLSRRTKLLLGGAGLTLLAAIATIAIIKGASGGGEQPEVTTEPPKTGSATTTTKSTPVATPIDSKKGTDKGTDKAAKGSTPKDIKTAIAKDAPKDTKPTDTKPTDTKPADTKASTPKDAKVTTTAAKDTKPTDTKATDTKAATPKDAKVTTTVAKDTKATDTKASTPKDTKVTTTAAKDTKATNTKAAKDTTKPTKPTKPAVTIKKTPKTTPKRVATADSSAALDKATALYRDKKFLEAAAAARPANASIAGRYGQLAAMYAKGMRQTTKPVDAWLALKTALTYDGQLGGAHTAEIQSKRAAIASQAALGFASRKNYPEALAAVKVAEANGVDTSVARKVIAGGAAELYEAARNEMDTNRNAALAKLRLVKRLVPQSNLNWGKADKLLSANGG